MRDLRFCTPHYDMIILPFSPALRGIRNLVLQTLAGQKPQWNSSCDKSKDIFTNPSRLLTFWLFLGFTLWTFRHIALCPVRYFSLSFAGSFTGVSIIIEYCMILVCLRCVFCLIIHLHVLVFLHLFLEDLLYLKNSSCIRLWLFGVRRIESHWARHRITQLILLAKPPSA